MQEITLPSKVYFDKEDGNRSVVIIEPLYPGYGVTIGNALRRVLLSSLPGAAVTAVKIKGVDHEFSTVPSVREDVVDIILNLKQLRFKVYSNEPIRLEIKAKGSRAVTGADVTKNSNAEVANPNLHIATLDGKDAELSMEILVQRGRGYVPVEMREGEKREIGLIAIDAIYTPVKNVNFEVENVRVGQITNYDKLTIIMETDGTITGREALDGAANILVEHFSLFKTSKIETLDESPESKDIAAEVESEEIQPESNTLALGHQEAGQTIESDWTDELKALGLSNRSYNALVKNKITSLDQLKNMNRDDLSALEGLGAKSVDEILKFIGKG